MCNYQGYEFGAGRYPDSYCVDGYLHDADSDYLNDELRCCPICDRAGAIQWWFDYWKDSCEEGDDRDFEVINEEHMRRATLLVDDIRFNRGITDPNATEIPVGRCPAGIPTPAT
ncbi:TPA: hypothetical protein ACKP0Q_000749 [Stenotrophomonas maltophilia]|uniref:hypothetical protein n=1 Tax=Stenotrophomonas sp. TaxID=69392 RepID=UPI0028AB40F7|nr:hypothetical protein [Stenotrophomonas sp.]